MSNSRSLPLSLLNGVQLALVAAVICTTIWLWPVVSRDLRLSEGSGRNATVAARVFADAIDRGLHDIDRDGRALGLVLRAGAEMSEETRTALLRDWLALHPDYVDLRVAGPRGVVSLMSNAEPAASDVRAQPWFQRAAADEMAVTIEDGGEGKDGRLVVAVPLDNGRSPERVVLTLGPGWIAGLEQGVRGSLGVDPSKLALSVRGAEGHLLTGGAAKPGADALGVTRTEPTRGYGGLPASGWVVTARVQDGSAAWLLWSAGFVIGAGLIGYALGGGLAARLRRLTRHVERDEAPAIGSRIAEVDALYRAVEDRIAGLERARDEAATALGRIKGRLGTFEALSGWTCWEVDPATQRVIWSDLDGREREGGEAAFSGDHAVDLAALAEGIEPSDRALMRLTMRTALAQDGPHDVALRTQMTDPEGRERRLLVRFRRTADRAGAAADRLFALSREIQLTAAESAAKEPPNPSRANERRRDHVLRRVVDGIVFDFNDVLTIVLANLDSLLRRSNLDEEQARLLRAAVAGAERGSALTRRMVAVARRESQDCSETDVPATVAAFVPFLQAKVLGDLPVRNALPETLRKVQCGERVVETSLLNLAFHFRETGFDSFVLGAGEETVTETGNEPRHFVRLVVSSERPAENGAEPSAKPGDRRGARRNLDAVAQLLATSGGHLRVVSDGRGTEPFLAELWMPAIVSASEEELPRTPSRPMRILLVQSDSLVRSSVAGALDGLGHSVVEAASGSHALEILAKSEGFDAMIADQSMPAMTGLELAATVVERHPDVKIIIASPHGQLPATARRFLHIDKPFRAEDVTAVLAAADAEPSAYAA